MALDPFKVAELRFNNQEVLVKAVRRVPEIRVLGSTIGGLEENGEFEVKTWIAEALEKSGLVKVTGGREEVNLLELKKIQLKETMQSSRRLSELPKGFYAKLKGYLGRLREEGAKDPQKLLEYQRAVQIAIDIVTARINKILMLSSTSEISEAIRQNLSPEEAHLHRSLSEAVDGWRRSLLAHLGVRG